MLLAFGKASGTSLEALLRMPLMELLYWNVLLAELLKED